MSHRIAGRAATEADRELFRHIETKLYTAVVADSLDQCGFRHQAMAARLRPLSGETFAGWARTIACVDMYHIPADPYSLELEALDSMLPGEAAVVGTANSQQNAPWGELLSTAAKARGAVGAVVDGLVRDVRKIQDIHFPLFAAGVKPVDSKGRGIVIDYNVPVDCGGVLVHPGDLVFADFDGVVVIPQAAVADVVRIATDKVDKEDHTRAELAQGAYLRDVYAKYGVL
jgi:4-hydroxy-4-methyl-2-oxoglutarate aldolase